MIKSTIEQMLMDAKQRVKDFPWEDRKAYANFLAQTYYYVLHSTRLLAYSASRVSLETSSPLHWRFLNHAREEAAHEKFALTGLKALKFKITDFPEFESTRAFYEPQYAKIMNEGATSFFGYILFLETYAANQGREIFRRISSVHGDEACKFVSVHADEDVDHVEKALKEVEKMTDQQKAQIETNLRQSAWSYWRMLDQCSQHVSVGHQKRAA